MTGAAVQVRDLTKAFGSNKALDAVSFDIPVGSVFGLLGPNGAGKTTFMKILLGLSRADSGRVEVFGGLPSDPSTRSRIGFVPDVPEFDVWMTASQYLESVSRLLGMGGDEGRRRSELLIQRVGLAGVETKIRGFSRGMRQRLGIAQALLNGPDLLILDEPTTALDPQGRIELLELIRDVSKHATVVFSTHLLDDVDRVCDSVLVLDTSVVTVSTMADLRASLDPQVEVTVNGAADQIDAFATDLAGEPWVAGVHADGGSPRTFTIGVGDPDQASRAIPEIAARSGVGIQKLSPVTHSMETIFMQLLGGRHV